VDAILWYLLVGGMLVAMAAAGTLVERLPLTTALLYLAAGALIGPVGLGLLRLDPLAGSALLERVTEAAVIVSLFTAGLKLRAPVADPIWRLPLRLASLSMAVTVGLVALAGVVGLGLPLGAAVLLGAILAPTDPVLAYDVQVEGPTDRDRLRFGLTGEAGLNDGTAFPFVMLGLGLLGVHDLGAAGWRWLAVDVLWAVAAGLGIGWGLGTLVARFVLYLRREHREAVGSDDFLALGLIALAYGAALLAHAYGFLAVFAAGLALRRIEARESGGAPPPPPQVTGSVGGPGGAGSAWGRGPEVAAATAPDTAPAYMAQAVLGFNEQLERIAEVAAVLLLGAMLTPAYLNPAALWFAPLLFLAIRPFAVAVGLAGSPAARLQRGLIAWFGVRGVGSLYYLAYAVQHGLPPAAAQQLASLTLSVVAASVVVHGVSVTPLMGRYARWRGRGR
jgi:NhaP-type Na+/H+ or K+/H+ antiporter